MGEDTEELGNQEERDPQPLVVIFSKVIKSRMVDTTILAGRTGG